MADDGEIPSFIDLVGRGAHVTRVTVVVRVGATRFSSGGGRHPLGRGGGGGAGGDCWCGCPKRPMATTC